MTKVELRMLYKAETADSPWETNVCAHIGRFGDVIVDPDLGSFEYPDLDYIEWLEEKVMELLSNQPSERGFGANVW